MIRVFAYLAWRSAYNRVSRQLRQLRNPRYLAALILGVGYIWLVAVQQRPAPAPPAGARWVELLGALGVIGAVLWGWVFGLERRVLSFTPAEVTFLFSGPVPRRGVVQYKLLRNQFVILFNACLWTLILARERFGASPWLRALSIWVLLTTISLHRLGASFVRTSVREHGRIALRHRVVSLTLLGAATIGVVWSTQAALPALTAGWSAGPVPFLDALAEAAAEPVPRALLAPFRAVIRPLAAHSIEEWVRAMGPALALLVLHYVWVIRADAAFEEAAAEASLRRLEHGRRGGNGSPRLTGRTLPRFLRLAPVGWPAGALLWKNLLAVVRTRRARSTAWALALAGAVGVALSFRADGTMAEIVGWLAATWAVLSVAIGPQWIRNDLRSDLLKLDLLRSYPLRGAAVVTSETLASSLVLTAMQLSLLLVAYAALFRIPDIEPGLETRTAALAAAAVGLPAVNFLGLLIHNGAAILYPAWVRLGAGRPGVEALGQNMLMITAYAAVLAAALTFPAAIAVAAFALTAGGLGWWAAIPAAVVLTAGIAIEARPVVAWLGRAFERLEPAAATPGS